MDPRDLVQRFAALCNDHDFDGLDAVIAPGYQQHNPMVPDGLEGIQQGFADFLRVFPDLTVTLDAVIAEGDLVAARFTWTGTQRSEFFGVPASGRTATWASTDWWRTQDGKLVEHWDVVDWAGLTAQLTTEPDGPTGAGVTGDRP